MRQTLIKAAEAFGLVDFMAQIEAASDDKLPEFIVPLMRAGGRQLQAIGGELSVQGNRIEGAKAQAEGKFYESY